VALHGDVGAIELERWPIHIAMVPARGGVRLRRRSLECSRTGPQHKSAEVDEARRAVPKRGRSPIAPAIHAVIARLGRAPSHRVPTSRDVEEEAVLRICSVAAAVLVLIAAAPALAQEAPVGYVAPEPGFSAPGMPAVNLVTPNDGRDAPSPEAPRNERDFHFDLGFGTEAPISVGGIATAELPGRVLLQLGLGFMPHGYAYAIDGFLTSVKAYDQTISNIIRSSLGNSFVLRASGGWRPFSGHGFEILGGYTLITLGGQTTAADVINAVLAESGSSQRVPSGMNADIPLSATLHNIHVSVGWRWLLADDHLVIRASLSYIQTLAANVGVSLANLPSQAAAMEGAVNQGLNGYLGPYFTSYAKAPTMGLSAAYRF
jgi:hypothetical protein